MPMDHHENIDGTTSSGSQDPHPEGTEGSLLSPGTSATGAGTSQSNNDVPAVSDADTDYTTTEQSRVETDEHSSYTKTEESGVDTDEPTSYISSDLGGDELSSENDYTSSDLGDENRVGSETGTTEADISDGREQKLPRVD
jgi:hypothetical protein